ncbi:MAG: response regulator receiver [Rhodospirillales bacterium]|jgi:CheY-like chemotaxis protein|nr:response regulator receiver [Rhodospirillales bacterium]
MSVLVLVVDDDPDIRTMAADVLRDDGFTVLEAEDASTAISLLGKNPGVEVLFTDIEMPGENGFVLAGRAVRLLPRVRVLYTSGRATLDDRRRERAIPGKMLAKPYLFAHLTSAVRDVCGSRLSRG